MSREIATLSELDERLLLLADSSSPEEISREIGGVLSPARVAAKIKQLLQERDWLTAAEEDELITWKMKRLLRKLEDSFQDLDVLKAQLPLLKAIGERLDKRRAATAEEMNSLRANQAQIVFDALKVMVEIANLDSDARAAVREALPEAVYVLAARNVGHEIES